MPINDVIADGAPVEIWVRATIDLPGFSRGQEARVDPSIPHIAEALENRHLIAIDDPDRIGDRGDDAGPAAPL
jgi:hypothetical protein